MTRAVRRASPFLVALWVLLAAPIHSSAQTTALYLDSQPGDYIGQGERQTITPGAIVFTASQSDPLIDDVVITAQTSNFSTVWRTWFVPPEGLSLAPGLYENTSRSQLDVSGMGRGCGGSNGRFHVYEIEYDETGTLTRFAADFEQHCEGQIPALFGAVRFNSTRASLVPFDGAYPVYSLTVTPASNGYVIGPEIDCGAGRVECVQTYTPGTVVALTPVATTGYLFLGWAGDCLGEHTATVAITRRRFCTPVFAAAPATGLPEVPDYSDGFFFIQGLTRDLEGIPDGPTRLAYLGLSPTSPVRSIIEPTRYRYSSAERALLTVKGPDGTTLELLFAAPSGSVLSPGDYLYTSTASDPSPVPMLAVGGACTQGGRFRLYEYSHDSQTGAVTTFAADFECGPNIAGTIRYRSTRKSLLPFDGNYPLHSLQVVPTAGGYVIGIGIACADGGTIDCTETYGSSTAVSLQAIASAGYEFVAWTGHCTGSQSTTTVLVDAATRCFAVFVPTRDGGAPDNPLFAASTLFIDSLGSAANRSIWLGQDSGVTTRVWPNAVNLTFTPVGSGSTATISFAVSDGVLALGDFEEQYEPAFGFSLSGCYGSVARFRIYEMTIDSAGRLLTFAADFEALCTRMVGQPHLVGAVRFNSQRPRIVPFDGEFPLTKLIIQPTVNGIVTAAGIDCGPASSDCVEIFGAPANAVLTATPLDGYRFIGWSGACRGEGTTTVAVSWIRTCTAVFNAIIPGTGIEDPRIRDRALMIDSQPGDNVGLGQRAILLDTNISAGHFSRSRISVLIETIDRTLWSIELQAPSGQELQAGIYSSAIEVSSAKGSPGILVRSSSNVCWSSTALVGRFIIYEVAFDSSTSSAVTSLAADFEQQCEPGGPSLTGSIRFHSTRSVLTPFAGSPSTPVPPPLRSDFNEDGWPDLVWRHSVSGRDAIWMMNGSAGSVTLGTPEVVATVTDLTWEIRAVGDINGDRSPDIIWQKKDTGRLAVWFFSGATLIGTNYIYETALDSYESDLDWKIVAAGDMNRDGHVDLLWRHRVSGEIRVWHMIRNARWDSVTVTTVADVNWEIVGLADMNGDGMLDFVWRHATTGQIAAWFMQDWSFQSAARMTPPELTDPNWHIVGVADMNMDAKPDLVWQNIASGALGVWFMNGLVMTHGIRLSPSSVLDLNWRIVGVK